VRAPISLDERRLVRALRNGDEHAYAKLHELYDARLLALARAHGCSHAAAQDVVQETWAAVARNIHSFEGRSTLKTWIFRILVNAANAHVKRERRFVPKDNVVELDAARVVQPDERLIWKETVAELRAAIATLPTAQRNVITLRDLHGWSAADAGAHLGISYGNQRVLLHRARAQVRLALAGYLKDAA
jgi:RNA polymerase sigma-70 factor (ECF subfamily)